jgi:uncharacterized protein YbdZ (MbtH family)
MTKLVKYWPVGKPIPKGWRRAKFAPSHHDRYSILIERKPKGKK